MHKKQKSYTTQKSPNLEKVFQLIFFRVAFKGKGLIQGFISPRLAAIR